MSLPVAVVLSALLAPQPASAGELLAIRVGRAETVADGALEHAVIVIDGDRIVTVGQDLEIERGIPVLDRPEWVVMPGLVNCYTRIGLDSRGKSSSEPQQLASTELYARQDAWEEVLEAGVTTLGLYPPGTGIPGQAVAVRPRGATAEEMIVRDRVYLKALLRSESSSKKMLRDGFEDADDYEEKEQKAREKYEKKKERLEKRKKRSKKKDKDEEDEEEDDDEEQELGPYEPPVPDPDVKPFLDLRAGTLTALFSIRKSADLLHLLDVIEKEDISWDLRVPLRTESDLYEVLDHLVEAGCHVILEPKLTRRPTTRRERNLPMELSRAGVPVVLIPNGGGISELEVWLHDVGNIVRFGLERGAALRAVTLAPAEVLGLSDQLGSIEPGKVANLVFFDGDPLQPTSKLQAVMLEGELVAGEENLR